MTFNVVTMGGWALGILIIPRWKREVVSSRRWIRGFYHPPFGKGGSIIPPLEKGGEGGLEKANKDRRDMELLIIYKISPYPSLLKRGTQLVPDIFIIPLWKREVLSSPR